MPRAHNRTGYTVPIADGREVKCIADSGRHYMDAKHWPEDRDYDVYAIPLKHRMYELIVARQVAGQTIGLADAARLADKIVTANR